MEAKIGNVIVVRDALSEENFKRDKPCCCVSSPMKRQIFDKKAHKERVRRFQRNVSAQTCTEKFGLSIVRQTLQESQRSERSPMKKPSKVRFDPVPTVHRIRPISAKYSADLWWSTEELKNCRLSQADYRTESADEKSNVLNYVEAYRETRKIIHSKMQLTGSQTEYLVMGLQAGLGGVEMYCDKEEQHRRQRSRQIVQSIVKVYSQKSVRKNERLVAALAQSLSSADRFWAIYLGKAQYSRA